MVYLALKEVALAGSPGTKSTKQASQQLLPAAVKAMQESMEIALLHYRFVSFFHVLCLISLICREANYVNLMS